MSLFVGKCAIVKGPGVKGPGRDAAFPREGPDKEKAARGRAALVRY